MSTTAVLNQGNQAKKDVKGCRRTERRWRKLKRGSESLTEKRKIRAEKGNKVSNLISQTPRAWKTDKRFKRRGAVTVKVHHSVCTTLKTPQSGTSKTWCFSSRVPTHFKKGYMSLHQDGESGLFVPLTNYWTFHDKKKKKKILSSNPWGWLAKNAPGWGTWNDLLLH